MFDQFSQYFAQILSLSIGGVSLVTIIANVIYCTKSIAKAKRDAKASEKAMQEQIAISKQYIEESFKTAVLPQKIKIDISEKIEKPIQEGLAKIGDTQNEQLQIVKQELLLILKILSKFTHTQKLTEEEQDELKELTGDMIVEEVKL